MPVQKASCVGIHGGGKASSNRIIAGADDADELRVLIEAAASGVAMLQNGELRLRV